MLRAAVFLFLGLCTGLAGCAQPGGGPTAGSSGRIQAAPPPGSFVTVGSAAGTNIGAHFESGDLELSLYFGMHFVVTENEAKPAHPETSGSGTLVSDPIVLDPVGAEEELDVALGWLAGRFPDRSDVKGWLLRSPDGADKQTYLLYVTLKSDDATNAVYIDVTRWAEAHRKVGA